MARTRVSRPHVRRGRALYETLRSLALWRRENNYVGRNYIVRAIGYGLKDPRLLEREKLGKVRTQLGLIPPRPQFRVKKSVKSPVPKWPKGLKSLSLE